MAKYENIIKVMDLGMVKPQKIYEAIHPIMKTLFPPEQFKQEQHLPEKMPYTEQEYDADLQWYEDHIITYYRKYSDRGRNNSPMMIVRTDGAKPHSLPENRRLMYPNGETIKGNAERYNIRNEIFLRNNMTPDGKEPLFPNLTDLQYQIMNNIVLMVKMSPMGMTLTKLDGTVNPHNPSFKRIVDERDELSYADFDNMKRDNGLEEILQQVNDKKLPFKRANNRIRELYVNETNSKNINKHTEFLHQTFKDNDIPIETYYVKFEEEP